MNIEDIVSVCNVLFRIFGHTSARNLGPLDVTIECANKHSQRGLHIILVAKVNSRTQVKGKVQGNGLFYQFCLLVLRQSLFRVVCVRGIVYSVRVGQVLLGNETGVCTSLNNLEKGINSLILNRLGQEEQGSALAKFPNLFGTNLLSTLAVMFYITYEPCCNKSQSFSQHTPKTLTLQLSLRHL